MDGYKFTDDNASEQHNTLVLLDTILNGHTFEKRTEFCVCGGTAMLFHGLLDAATVDIDVCNTVDKTVLELVEPFISDAARDVIKLPTKWQSRVVRYGENVFKNFDVYILSLADIVVTKLYAWRYKDREDLKYTSILRNVDGLLLRKIIREELPESISDKLILRLESI